MNIKNCARCGKLFNQVAGRRLCPDCMRTSEEKFTEVRNYLYEHPDAVVEDILSEIDVDEDDLLGWLRDGRLIMRQDSRPFLTCMRCGDPIKTGRYCDRCTNVLRFELTSSVQSMRGEPKREPVSDRDSKSRGLHVDIGRDKK